MMIAFETFEFGKRREEIKVKVKYKKKSPGAEIYYTKRISPRMQI